jgi:MerR family transcriptional regulator/heat shock protein HspR
VAERTGIPVTTLRFYERELPALFRIRKTSGGHRRYGETDVARFVTVRRLSESGGLGLSEIRSVIRSGGEPDALEEELERLDALQAAESDSIRALERRVTDLEARIAALEAGGGRRRGWLGRRGKA